MAKAPCYDTVNKKDCPRRSWCKEVGRSQCPEWTAYEAEHQKELEMRHQKSLQRSAEYESNIRIRKMVHHRNRY